MFAQLHFSREDNWSAHSVFRVHTGRHVHTPFQNPAARYCCSAEKPQDERWFDALYLIEYVPEAACRAPADFMPSVTVSMHYFLHYVVLNAYCCSADEPLGERWFNAL